MKRITILITTLILSTFSLFAQTKTAALTKKTFLPAEILYMDINITSGSLVLKQDFIDEIIVDVKGDLDAAIPKINVKNGCLYVKTSVFSSPKKNHMITISVPYGLTLKDVKLISTGANMRVEGLSVNSITTTTAGGNLEYININCQEYIKPATGSGKILFDNCEAKSLIGSTVYGKITVNKGSFNLIQSESINGQIEIIDASTNQFQVQSKTGKIDTSFKGALNLPSFIKASSGDVSILLPYNCGYTIDFKTDFGRYQNENTDDIAVDEFSKTYGNGNLPLTLESGSGNFIIKKSVSK